MNDTAIIILAAGSSSRLGGRKQLLRFHNKSLLQHVIDEALAPGARVIVVTGAYANEIVPELHSGAADIIINENWSEGMASSIVAGLQRAMDVYPAIEKLIFTVCDQPFVSRELFKQMDQLQQQTKANIVACAYAGTTGTPVLLTQRYFSDLLALKGDEGAKKIIRANEHDMAVVDFPGGEIDIDTREGYEDLTLRD